MSVEERRKEIQEIREAHKRISDILVQGTEYHESIMVRCTDRQEHEVDVYALNGRDLIKAFETAGADLKEIGNPDKLVGNLKLMDKIAELVTHDPEITKCLMPLESSKIALKAFEISGLSNVKGSPKAA